MILDQRGPVPSVFSSTILIKKSGDGAEQGGQVSKSVLDLARDMTISLAAYDLPGRLIDRLVDGEHFGPSNHPVEWRGRDNRSRTVGSGTYFLRLVSGNFVETRRKTLLE